jgi:hypothetical protein
MYSAKVFEMDVSYSQEEITLACVEVVKRSDLKS